MMDPQVPVDALCTITNLLPAVFHLTEALGEVDGFGHELI